jgi:hypothetical protein
MDILAVNEMTDDQTEQKTSFLKSVGFRLLNKEAAMGVLREIVRKSTEVIAR